MAEWSIAKDCKSFALWATQVRILPGAHTRLFCWNAVPLEKYSVSFDIRNRKAASLEASFFECNIKIIGGVEPELFVDKTQEIIELGSHNADRIAFYWLISI